MAHGMTAPHDIWAQLLIDEQERRETAARQTDYFRDVLLFTESDQLPLFPKDEHAR